MADMALGRFIVGSVERSIKDVFFSYYSHLVSFAAAIVQDGRLAEDIVQDLFLKLCSSIREFKDEHSLSCFLYTSVKNSAIDELRRRSKRSGSNDEDVMNSIPDESSFADIVTQEEFHRLLEKAIASLPKQSRKVMELSLKSYSNIQIADELGISVNTVKTLKARSLKKMKEITHLSVILLGWLFV